MSNPRNLPISTINSTTPTEITPPTGVSLGGGMEIIRIYNDSDTDMDYGYFGISETQPTTAAQVRAVGSTLLKQTSRLITINSASRLYVVSDATSSGKKVDVDWLGIRVN